MKNPFNKQEFFTKFTFNESIIIKIVRTSKIFENKKAIK